MKFTNETINILKNFASVNSGIVFKPGSELKTIHPQKTIMASARISESIPGVARIYDLPRFLATLSLFDDPDVEFKDDRFIISSNNRTVSYTYAAEAMIITPPDKGINFPSPDLVVNITWKDLDSVIRAAGVLKLSEIAFINNNNKISVSAVDSKNTSADVYSVVLGDCTQVDPFKMIIKVDNLKLVPNDYEVSLSSKGLAYFKSNKVDYYIALEATK
jgi:hypothetical protein